VVTIAVFEHTRQARRPAVRRNDTVGSTVDVAALTQERVVPTKRGNLARNRALGELASRERRDVATQQQTIDSQR
jgi:hypothetical protein